MRIFAIKQDMNAASLRQALLSPTLTGPQSTAAFTALQQLNPQVDLQTLRAGTVLFVPDAPAFNASASHAVVAAQFDSFEQAVRQALQDAATRVKGANTSVADEASQIAKVFRSAAFKRLAESDAEVRREVEAATDALRAHADQAEQAEQTLTDLGREVLVVLRELRALATGPD